MRNLAEYWDRYATKGPDDTPEEALKNAFGWTQYNGHGPGDELLDEPRTALELGSGRGNAVAALATKGVDATGIDISPSHTTAARTRWGQLHDAHYLVSNVLNFLTPTSTPVSSPRLTPATSAPSSSRHDPSSDQSRARRGQRQAVARLGDLFAA